MKETLNKKTWWHLRHKGRATKAANIIYQKWRQEFSRKTHQGDGALRIKNTVKKEKIAQMM